MAKFKLAGYSGNQHSIWGRAIMFPSGEVRGWGTIGHGPWGEDLTGEKYENLPGPEYSTATPTDAGLNWFEAGRLGLYEDTASEGADKPDFWKK